MIILPRRIDEAEGGKLCSHTFAARFDVYDRRVHYQFFGLGGPISALDNLRREATAAVASCDEGSPLCIYIHSDRTRD